MSGNKASSLPRAQLAGTRMPCPTDQDLTCIHELHYTNCKDVYVLENFPSMKTLIAEKACATCLDLWRCGCFEKCDRRQSSKRSTEAKCATSLLKPAEANCEGAARYVSVLTGDIWQHTGKRKFEGRLPCVQISSELRTFWPLTCCRALTAALGWSAC